MRYLSVLDAIALNDQIMAMARQTAQVLEEGLLAGTMMRPQMAAYYENADVVVQTALLVQGIALAHAFVDGNKRTALAAGTIFLRLNGYYIASSTSEYGQQIEQLVMHSLSLEDFIVWLRERLRANP
jgi:death on curing protein